MGLVFVICVNIDVFTSTDKEMVFTTRKLNEQINSFCVTDHELFLIFNTTIKKGGIGTDESKGDHCRSIFIITSAL